MTIEIDIIDETGNLTEEQHRMVEELLTFAAEQENITQPSEVSVTFVTNEKIQLINKEYRHKNQPTDVISFALEELSDNEIVIQGAEMPRVLGDIIISIDRAIEQASEYGHSLDREMGFLAVHGFLHLLGYDHMNKEDESVMFSRQNDILTGYGLQR